MANVLIVDDDPVVCEILSALGRGMGHAVTTAMTLGSCLEGAASGAFDVVFLDVWLPDGNGLEALPRLRAMSSAPEVIIVTGAGDPNGAELAVKSGAWDYIEKPSSVEAVQLALSRAIQYREQRIARDSAEADHRSVVALKRREIVGNSPRIQACLDLVAQAASGDANVLVTGETGTGKECFARAVHENSVRAKHPFMVVDCAALPETLVESILFGHGKGVFTGADKPKEGLIAQADGGTLVLDEVGELPLSVQKAFLRVLQERRFRPLGGSRELSSNFRLISVTNRNLEEMVDNGQFRKDLFYRLRAFGIELPPLRERSEDTPDLALYHVNRLCERYGINRKVFSPEFLDTLCAYSWPGNIRELVHALEKALYAAQREPVLFPVHLPIHIRVQVVRSSVKGGTAVNGTSCPVPPSGELPRLRDFREKATSDAEREYLQRVMARPGVDIKEACRISGLSRPRLYGLLKKYGMTGSSKGLY